VLFAVRAFYLDLAQWALEDPSWTPWAVPCPVRLDDVRGSMKHKRRRTATMHQRTRTLAPLLPQLVASVEDRLGHLERLVAATAATPVGGRFEVDGESFERIQAASDRKRGGQAGAGHLRARRLADDQRLDLTRDEDEAFWTWAIVETLRHTGIRLEELLELTHFALVTHTLPDTGEIVPLLQVTPSKQDAERLLLVSPELAHVLARIVHRVRAGRPDVPLLARYDYHERVTGPPLPHLFQRWHGTELRVICPAVVKRLLNLAIERAGLRGPDGQPLRYTPHDFRRIFATEAVSGGLPVHIAAKVLGHQDLNTTQAYAAVYQDDVLRHYRAFISRRRAQRPSGEYRQPTIGRVGRVRTALHQAKGRAGHLRAPLRHPLSPRARLHPLSDAAPRPAAGAAAAGDHRQSRGPRSRSKRAGLARRGRRAPGQPCQRPPEARADAQAPGPATRRAAWHPDDLAAATIGAAVSARMRPWPTGRVARCPAGLAPSRHRDIVISL
jgi:integrase